MNEDVKINWESVITIHQEKISKNKFIIQGIYFYLDDNLIALLQQKNLTISKFKLPDEIINLWQNYLINRSVIYGLNFTSFYTLNNFNKAVLKTNIDVEGKINNYVNESLISESQLLKDISLTHYYLINQLIIYPNITTKTLGKSNINKWQIILICIFCIIVLVIII